MTEPTTQTTDYDRLGGRAGIQAAVDVFYDEHAVNDPVLGPIFVGRDLPRIKGHMVFFLASITGGKEIYTGRDIGEVHQDLGLGDEHVDRVRDHMDLTLVGLGVESDIRDRIREKIEGARPVIVSGAE